MEDNNLFNLFQAQKELSYLKAAINAVTITTSTGGGGSQTFFTGRHNSG